MGGEPYQYVVEYEDDVQSALEKLRRDVFRKGEFHGAERNPATPEDALQAAAEDGTRSILDIIKIVDKPDYCCAAPLSSDELIEYFGTERPTVEMVDTNEAFWEDLNRGMARYVAIYEEDKPSKLFFAGYSFD